jgi:lysophospholipase L1-like esterase
MTIVRKNAACFVLLLLASPVLMRAQAQPDAQTPPACDCAAAEKMKAKIETMEKKLNDWPDLAHYREENAKLAAPAEDEQRVVFMGDSITDMWVLPKFGGFFPGKPYIGRGIGGQTTPQMLLRFREDVLQLHPKVVVILAGTNDIAGNTGPMTHADTVGNLMAMVELAHVRGIRVVLSSLLPVSNYGQDAGGKPIDMTIGRPPGKILRLNAWIQKFAEERGHVYLDYFSAMVDEKGMLKKELTEDGLHPNAAGYAVMAPLAEKAIQAALRAKARTE